MQSRIIKKQGLKVKLEVKIPASEVNAGFEKSLAKLQKTTHLPGFRPGKVPLSNIKQAYAGHLQESTAKRLFDDFCPKVLSQNQLRPAGPASLIELDLEENQEGRFVLSLEVHPEISSINYKNFKIKKPDSTPTPEYLAIKMKLFKMMASKLKISSYKGPAKEGNILTIHFKVFSLPEKKPIKIQKSQSILKINKAKTAYNNNVFNEHVKGLHLNEEKEFDFQFPKDFNEVVLSNRYCRVLLKILSFNEIIPPEKEEDIAKRIGFPSLDDLKAHIKETTEKELAQKAQQKMEDVAMKLLMEKNPIDIPETLIQEKKQDIIDKTEKKLIQLNETPDRRKAHFREKDSEIEQEAKTKMHLTYLIQKLIDDWHIQVEEKDLETHFKKYFPDQDPKMLRQNIDEDTLKNILSIIGQQKVLDILIKEADLY